MPSEALHDSFDSRLQVLWVQAQAGDQQAYHEALRLLAGRLRRYFGRRWTGMPDNVEDLVQETLLALHLQRASHDPGRPLEHWLLAIARHKLVDAWRRHGRREALHEPLDEMADTIDDMAVGEASAGRDLHQLLALLPASQHRAIVLTRLSGLTMSEASVRTGVSVSALKVQVHRGLKKLAEAALKDGPGHRPLRRVVTAC